MSVVRVASARGSGHRSRLSFGVVPRWARRPRRSPPRRRPGPPLRSHRPRRRRPARQGGAAGRQAAHRAGVDRRRHLLGLRHAQHVADDAGRGRRHGRGHGRDVRRRQEERELERVPPHAARDGGALARRHAPHQHQPEPRGSHADGPAGTRSRAVTQVADAAEGRARSRTTTRPCVRLRAAEGQAVSLLGLWRGGSRGAAQGAGPRDGDAAGDSGQFFQARRATQRGAHLASGRPVWPSKDDKRLVPASGSLVGEHAFAGQGVPESFRFAIPAMQDFMPVVAPAAAGAGRGTRARTGRRSNRRADTSSRPWARGASAPVAATRWRWCCGPRASGPTAASA